MFTPLWLVPLTLAVAVPGPDYALAPGFERLYARVAQPAPGELPDGLVLARVSVPVDHVEALYAPRGAAVSSCEAAPLCLTLRHPSTSQPGDLPAGPYVVRVTGAAAPAPALAAGVASRLAAAPEHAPWREVKPKLPPRVAPPAPSGDAPSPADRDAAFRALLAPDPDLARRLLALDLTPARAVYHLRGDDGSTAQVELIDRGVGQDDPAEVTRSFHVRGLGALTSPPDLPLRVHRAVMATDDGALRLAPQDVMARGERPPLHTALIALSALCLLILALATPLVLRAAFRVLGPHPPLLAVLAVGAALRLALPGRLVEMGIGYQLVRFADTLTLPRYGAGTTTLHHLVFGLFGADHHTMLWTHAVLGALTLPVAAALGARLLADSDTPRRLAATLFAAALALTPVLLRSDLTESNLVVVLWALWTALFAWRELTGPLRVAVTAAGLAFAGLSRPEMLAIAPALFLALNTPWRASPRAAALTLALTALALAPQAAFITHVIGFESAEQSLHLTKGLSADRLLAAIARNGVFDPRVTPLAVPVLALAALTLRDARRRVALWLIGGLLWLYVYAIDLSGASVPRLHIVAVIPFSLAAALAAARLAAARPALGTLAAAAWLASAVPTALVLWQPTNEDSDLALYERAAAALPADTRLTLAALATPDAPDPPGHFTHRHVPAYRFPAADVVALSAIPAALAADRAPVYYLQTTSCYAEIGRKHTGATGLLPACAAVHAHFHLEPIFVTDLENRGNPVHQEMDYYGPDASFQVGLWRLSLR